MSHYTIEIVDFPIKNCDFPIKNCDFPINSFPDGQKKQVGNLGSWPHNLLATSWALNSVPLAIRSSVAPGPNDQEEVPPVHPIASIYQNIQYIYISHIYIYIL